jgi:hypothetical protein
LFHLHGTVEDDLKVGAYIGEEMKTKETCILWRYHIEIIIASLNPLSARLYLVDAHGGLLLPAIEVAD